MILNSVVSMGQRLNSIFCFGMMMNSDLIFLRLLVCSNMVDDDIKDV